MRLRSVLTLLPVFGVLLSGCGGDSRTTTVPTGSNSTNITVTVTPTSAQNVDAGQTVALTASVANDQGSKGVQWSVAAGAGTLASATGASNTYTAPAGAATGVVVTATSVADPTKTASVTVNVFALPGFSTLSPLPVGYANIAYSTTLVAVGGIGAKAVSLASGTLPPGLALSNSGVLSGTPTAVGTYTFTAQVADSAATPVTTTATYSVTVVKLAIDPVQLPGGVVGSTYGPVTVTSSGAIGAVSYSISSGALPAGLSLTSAGVLSGTPTATGTSNFTILATDAGGQSAVASYTVAVATKLALANVTVPSGNVGTATASYQFQATGGTTPYTYTLASGSVLPAGLSLTTSGVLYGTPTAAGDYSFNVVVTDGGSATGGATPIRQTATATATLHVSAFALAGGTLPSATQNAAYTATLQPTGGTTPYTFAVTSGSLPTGLMLNGSSGVISGTPTGSGVSSFSVTLTDADGRQATATYKLAVLIPVTFSTASALPGGMVGTAYSATVQATGGTGPYTYAVSAGSSLPANLLLNSTSGAITGTLATAASNSFGLTATDAAGGTASATFTLAVASQLTFANVALPGANTGIAIASYTFAPSGGTAPYTFAVAAGSTLPAGLTLSTSGVLSGAPSTAGSYSFGVTSTDSGSSTSGSSTPPQQTATATVTLVVTDYVITTTAIPNIVPQSAYTYMTTVTGGTAPYSYAVSGGSLPNGIALNATTGRIEGTTAASPATYTFTEKVTDANGNVTTKMLSVNVSTTLSPGPNNALLNGHYAFTFSGFTNGSAASTVYGTASVGVFTFDGASAVTSTYDVNSAIGGFQSGQMVSGSYTLNADQRGTVVFTSNGVTTTININVSKMSGSVASQIGLLEFDDQDPSDPNQLVGGGVASLQTSTTTNLLGQYVFGLKGETSSSAAGSGQFGSETAAGYLTIDGSGAVVAGKEDVASYGHFSQSTSILGSTALTDTTLGRGTFTLTGLAGVAAPSSFVYYSVSPTLLYVMSADAHNGSVDLLSGTVEQQTGTAFTNQSLSGTVIGYDSGSDGGDGQTAYQNATFADVYRMVFTPSTSNTTDGTVTLTGMTNQNGMASTLASMSGTYSVGADGRVTIVTPSMLTLRPIYLTDTNTGVGVTVSTTNKGSGTLKLEAQTATALSDGVFGYRTQQTTTRSYGLQGTAAIANGGTTAAENLSYVLFDQPVNHRLLSQTTVNTTVSVDNTTGALVVGSDATNAYSGYVINGSKAATVLTLQLPYVPAVIFQK